MKHNLLKIIAFIAAFTFFSCSDNNIDSYITEDLSFETITNIDIQTNAEVYLEIGTQQSVTMTGTEEALNQLSYNYDEGKLSFSSYTSDVLQSVVFYITVAQCDTLTLKNNADLFVDKETFKTPFVLSLHENTSAHIEKCNFTEANFITENNSELYLSNIVLEQIDIQANDNSNIHTFDINTNKAQIDLWGSSDLMIKAFESDVFQLNGESITDAKVHTLISDSTIITGNQAADIKVMHSTSTDVNISQYDESRIEGKTFTITNGSLTNTSSQALILKAKKESKLKKEGKSIQLIK